MSTSYRPLEELAQGSETAIDRRRRAALVDLEKRLVIADVGGGDRGRRELFVEGLFQPAGEREEIGAVVDDRLLCRLLPFEIGKESSQVGVGDGCGACERHRFGTH